MFQVGRKEGSEGGREGGRERDGGIKLKRGEGGNNT